MERVRSTGKRLYAASRTLLAVSLLAGASASSAETGAGVEGRPGLPDFVGTWHVLIHYQVPDGPHPDRWKWDERVWVIEPSDDGLDWTEHAIVSFQDPSGRFEHLGTNRARRLLGPWEPNERQQEEIVSGLSVSGRGVRHKHLLEVGAGQWRSDSEPNAIGQSSSGLGYNEVWSIQEDGDATFFAIDTRLAVSGLREEESAGATLYRGRRVPENDASARYRGDYARTDEHRGRFRLTPTRIRIPASDDPTDASARPDAAEPSLLDMIPDANIHSSVPLLLSLLRPVHYYEDRRLVVESTPPGAEVDVAYLRRGSQLLYRRGRAPLVLELPTRLQSAPSDRLLIRGFLPGHERTRRSVAVDEADDTLELVLPPLANQVLGVAHGSVAGRSVLELRSQERPTVRVAEDERGFTFVLVRTGLRPELALRLAALRDPLLSFDGRQLGDDFVLRIDAPAGHRLDLRHWQIEDPSREETRVRIEIDTPAAADRSTRLRRAVDAMGAADRGPCGGPYEDTLRAELADDVGPTRLGRDDHPYRATLRAALRRLASTQDQTLRTRGGEQLGTATPLEFELAWSRSDEIEGYLAWLHALARRIDPRDDGALAFRSWVAPDWSPVRFAGLLQSASDARARCRAATASPQRS